MKKMLSWFFSCKLAGLFKLSFIVGSHAAFFSGVNIANPLIGKYNTVKQTLSLFSLLFISKFLMTGTLNLHFLAFILPGMFAALYWNVKGPLVKLFVPSLCFALFLLHPTGIKAAPYACYWLIPIALYFYRSPSFLLQALSSTLIAHAVGSVIWIYTVPMSSTAWLGLIPIVFLERMTFALGITVCHSLIEAVVTVPKKRFAS